MNMKTQVTDRRILIDALSEHLGVPAEYAGAPTFAYRIGKITVERDGSLSSESDLDLEALKPYLMQKGFIADDSGTMSITCSADDFTAENLRNLIYMLYAKQYLLNQVTQTQNLLIRTALITRLREQVELTLDLIQAALLDSKAAGGVVGFEYQNGKVSMAFPFDESKPLEWAVYGELLSKIVAAARDAKRVQPTIQKPENEKYAMRSWLLRLGYAGPEFKSSRQVLMQNLKGQAAFATEEKATAHREKYAQIRRKAKEVHLAASELEANAECPVDLEATEDLVEDECNE